MGNTGRFIFLLLTVLLVQLTSCDKREGLEENNPFTEIIWGQPEILHKPAGLGWFNWVTCPGGYAYKYNSDGSYSFDDYCMGIHLDGQWAWIEKDQTLELDTYYSGIYQYSYEITIIEVTSERLHTIVKMEGAAADEYYEFSHQPRKDQ